MGFTLPSPPQINYGKALRYLLRLPLFTRMVLFALLVFTGLRLQSSWDVPAWGALVPQAVNLGTSRFQGHLQLLYSCFSVSTQYLSIDTHFLVACHDQHTCCRAAVGAL